VKTLLSVRICADIREEAIEFDQNGFWVALEAGSEVNVDNGLLEYL